jgi:hypothetical protein
MVEPPSLKLRRARELVVESQRRREIGMKFMILVKAEKNSEAGVLPDETLLTEMGKYNEELAKAGVMLIRPSRSGWKRAAEGSIRPQRVRA